MNITWMLWSCTVAEEGNLLYALCSTLAAVCNVQYTGCCMHCAVHWLLYALCSTLAVVSTVQYTGCCMHCAVHWLLSSGQFLYIKS